MDFKKLQKKIGISLIFLVIISIAFSAYFLLFYYNPCEDYECFVKSINNCKRISWIREDPRATWLYMIKGDAETNTCEIIVRLLKIKEGDVKNEKLEGKEMICSFKKDNKKFPEEDLSKCSGLLKEELQNEIIQKMHAYLLANVGEIKEGFKGV